MKNPESVSFVFMVDQYILMIFVSACFSQLGLPVVGFIRWPNWRPAEVASAWPALWWTAPRWERKRRRTGRLWRRLLGVWKWDEMRAGHVSVGLWIVWIGRKLKTDETGNGVPFFPHIYVGERNQLSQVATQMFSPNPPCYSSERWVCLKCWFLNVSKLSTLVFL